MSPGKKKKDLSRKGKADPWCAGRKGISKRIWHRIWRQYGKQIVQDEIKDNK